MFIVTGDPGVGRFLEPAALLSISLLVLSSFAILLVISPQAPSRMKGPCRRALASSVY